MIKVALDDKAVKTVQKTIGGSSSLYTYYVKTEDIDSNLYTFTFQCDSPELDSYDKLAEYLLLKGYYERKNAVEGSILQYGPQILAVALDRTSSGNIITGLFVKKDGSLRIVGRKLYISSGQLYSGIASLKFATFEITLVTY